MINYCLSDGMIDAPPSFKPAMKYSDLSGLPVSTCMIPLVC